jgi:hypothetical protein
MIRVLDNLAPGERNALEPCLQDVSWNPQKSLTQSLTECPRRPDRPRGSPLMSTEG